MGVPLIGGLPLINSMFLINDIADARQKAAMSKYDTNQVLTATMDV